MTKYDEPNSPRFDIYSVERQGEDVVVRHLMTDLTWLVAEMVSGIPHEKFAIDMYRNGWSGHSPEWCRFNPIVVMPRGSKLQIEQWRFLQEEAEV